MRTSFLAAGLALAVLVPLSGCDTTGVDDICDGDCDGTPGGHPGDGGQPGRDASAFVPVDPRQTYTLTSAQDYTDVDAPAVDLSALGYAPGHRVCFRAEGDYIVDGTERATERDLALVTAVFSSTPELLSGDLLERVPGAIEAGEDYITLDTFLDDLATDISQDFVADDVCLTIPDGARYVFFATVDSYYSDNTDARVNDRPFGVRIQK